MWFQDLFNYDFRRTEMGIIPYAPHVLKEQPTLQIQGLGGKKKSSEPAEVLHSRWSRSAARFRVQGDPSWIFPESARKNVATRRLSSSVRRRGFSSLSRPGLELPPLS